MAYFVCVLLGVLTKFSVDPYYELLSWFMIHKVENIFSTVWLVLFSIQRVLCVLDSDKVS